MELCIDRDLLAHEEEEAEEKIGIMSGEVTWASKCRAPVKSTDT